MAKAFIDVISPDDAQGILKRAYRRIGGSRRNIANIHQSQSLNPKAMMAHFDLYIALMYEESPLNRIQRELIGTVVSYFNDCNYCITHHYEALLYNWKDAPKIEKLVIGEGLANQDREMVKFAKKLTLNKEKICLEDTNSLKQLGFDDRAILDITLIIGYFNFVNRLVLGLGVKLEEEEERNYKY